MEYTVTLRISFRFALLAPRQQYDCPNVSETTLKDMDKKQTDQLRIITYPQQNKTVCIIYGIYSKSVTHSYCDVAVIPHV